MRLIDADALKANIDNWYALVNEWGQTRITLSHKDIINKIDNQPTVDVTIPLAEQEDSKDKIIRRTLENFMRGLWEEIQVGELKYTTSEVYEMLEREIFTDNHVAIPSAESKTGHCKDCKHFRKLPYHADKLGKCVQHWGFCPPSDWYCADFESQERGSEE